MGLGGSLSGMGMGMGLGMSVGMDMGLGLNMGNGMALSSGMVLYSVGFPMSASLPGVQSSLVGLNKPAISTGKGKGSSSFPAGSGPRKGGKVRSLF